MLSDGRIICLLMLSVGLGCLGLGDGALAQAWQAAPAQPARSAAGARGAEAASPCPEGRPRTGDLGIGWYQCAGGSCSVDTGRAHRFSAEPRIWDVDPAGPAAGKLRDGDVLTAIDGFLVTTPEGGRRLANLTPGAAVTLRVRRDGRESDVRVVPATGCNVVKLIVTAAATPGRPDFEGMAARRPGTSVGQRAPRSLVTVGPAPEPEAWLGLGIGCEACGWEAGPDGALVWSSSTWPVVRSVEKGSPADAAGLVPGDVVTHVDRLSLLTEQGGRRLGAVRPGEEVALTYRRGGSEHTATLTAKPRPATPRRM